MKENCVLTLLSKSYLCFNIWHFPNSPVSNLLFLLFLESFWPASSFVLLNQNNRFVQHKVTFGWNGELQPSPRVLYEIVMVQRSTRTDSYVQSHHTFGFQFSNGLGDTKLQNVFVQMQTVFGKCICLNCKDDWSRVICGRGGVGAAVPELGLRLRLVWPLSGSTSRQHFLLARKP